MKSVYSAVFFLLISGILFAFATRQEYSQTIIKEFPIQATGTVDLRNSFGPVEVFTWNQNRVKVHITITVRAASEQKAQYVFDEVDVAFANTPTHFSAQTQINSGKSWWDWDEEKKDFSIQYQVWIPNTVQLNIDNKYGDILIAEMKGKTSINLQYGNIQLQKLSEDLYLDFSHGTGQIGQVKDIEGKLSYCNLQLEQARDLKLETSYSNLQIEHAAEMFINAKYNNFKIQQISAFDYEGRYDVVDIEQVDRFRATAKYSDFRLGNVTDNASFDLEFGVVNIEHISPQFSEVNLVGQFTDYKVNLEPGTPYMLQAAADYAGVSYPASLKVTFEKESSTFHEVEGYHGKAQGVSVIRAQLNYGGLKVTN
ncbi:MAG: hypothetical protein KDC34_04520 [Saprospiraceae bacterium]|nr:hypothetical protein [Saprospiraceae bacterium]